MDNPAPEGADQEVAVLLNTVLQQPWDRKAHCQYILLLRNLGELDKVCEARQCMSNYHALSPEMWKEWIDDAMSLKHSEMFDVIENLYERAVQEYQSIPLWLHYLHHMEQHYVQVSQCTPPGLSKMRELFERAVVAGGLHTAEGSKLWAAYRKYEMGLLMTTVDDDEKAKQSQQIRSLFQRQLSVPLRDMEQTLAEYRTWEAEQQSGSYQGSEVDYVPSNVTAAYEAAYHMYNERRVYEEELLEEGASAGEKLQAFQDYIRFEENQGCSSRIESLYERAVAECPFSSELWIGYTRYMDKNPKVRVDHKCSIHFRATKNCHCISDIWIYYLEFLESNSYPEQTLKQVFEYALHLPFKHPEYVNLSIARVAGIRRRMKKGVCVDVGVLIGAFEYAVYHLSTFISPVLLLPLYEYWADSENEFGSQSNACTVYENLLKMRKTNIDLWRKYIAMEMKLKHVDKVRSLYKRCYSLIFPEEDREEICKEWVRFEREYGKAVEDVDYAEDMVNKLLPYPKEADSHGSQSSRKRRYNNTKQRNRRVKRKYT